MKPVCFFTDNAVTELIVQANKYKTIAPVGDTVMSDR